MKYYTYRDILSNPRLGSVSLRVVWDQNVSQNVTLHRGLEGVWQNSNVSQMLHFIGGGGASQNLISYIVFNACARVGVIG